MMALRRMREHLPLFAALLAVVGLLSGVAVGVVASLAREADAGVRAGFAQRSGGDLALRADLPLAPDAQRQDAQVLAAIDRSFAPLGVDVDVTRSVDGRVTLRLPEGDPEVERPAMALSADWLPEHTELTSGAFGVGDRDVAVQAVAAELLGLSVGSTVTLDGVAFTVTGTWTVDDHLDPRWYGDPIVVSGERDLIGPFAIDVDAFAALGADPKARWVVAPRVQQLGAGDLRPLADAWLGIGTDWRGSVDGIGELGRQNRLVQTVTELGARVDGLRAALPLNLLMLAVVGVVALAELTRQLVAARAADARLRWARGTSPAAIVAVTALEAAAAALVGAIVGVAAGTAVVLVAGGGATGIGIRDLQIPVIGSVLVVVATALLAGVAQGGELRRILPTRDRSRIRRAAVPSALVLIGGAAALSTWQLRLYGTPVTTDAQGLTGVDPVAVPAPALALVTIVLLGLAAVTPLARLVAGWPLRSIPVQLVARAIARRAVAVGSAFVVVALAAGSVVVAGAYAATWSSAFDRTSAVRAGADLRISTSAPGLSGDVLRGLARQPGVDAVAPLHVEPIAVVSEDVTLVAVVPGSLPELARTPPDVFDAGRAAAAIDREPTDPLLPDGASAVATTARLTGYTADPSVAMWVADRAGILTRLDASAERLPDPADGTTAVRYTVRLPAEIGAARVVAIDLAIPADALTAQGFGSFRLGPLDASTAAGATEQVDERAYWLPNGSDIVLAPPTPDGTGRGFSAYDDTRAARLTPSLDLGAGDRLQPEVVVSQALADLLKIERGGLISFALASGYDRLTCRVADIVPVIPGTDTDAALLIDLAIVQHYQLRVRETPPAPFAAWVATDDAQATIDAARSALPASSRFQQADDATGRRLLGSAAAALGIGAIGCLVLAVIGVAAAVGSETRARRGELAVLRALGLSSGTQAVIRVGELASVAAAGLLTGLGAGALVSLLTIPQLAGAAVPERPEAVGLELAIAWGAVVSGILALTAAVAAVAVLAGIRVREVARRALPEAPR